MATRKAPKRIENAHFIAWVDSAVDLGALVNDLKVYTWEKGCECAVVDLRGGRRAIVAGGSHGISFKLRHSAFVDPFGHRMSYAVIVIDGQPLRIDRLVCHTHPPPPTGPSADDIRMLELLEQDESIIFEINGDADGTIFHRH